jgi:hypothetical protein
MFVCHDSHTLTAGSRCVHFKMGCNPRQIAIALLYPLYCILNTQQRWKLTYSSTLSVFSPLFRNLGLHLQTLR